MTDSPQDHHNRRDFESDPKAFRNLPDEPGRIAPLKELDDFDVASDEPDIRGWKVRSSDNREVGKVKELIADTGALKVRYLEVALDRKELNLDDDRRVLVPIGSARLNDDDDVVVIDRPAQDFAALPEYDRKELNRGYEDRLRGTWASGRGATSTASSGVDYYDSAHYDDRGFFGSRRKGREDTTYITRRQGTSARNRPPDRNF